MGGSAPDDHLALVGPTACGKSELAMAVARAFGDIEIVSLDSMQVYRGLDIGTAKPGPAERREVVHHLVDVADPAEEWNVARSQRGARAAIADIEQRGHRALLVGGTGLYVQAVVDDVGLPAGDDAVRAAIEERLRAPDELAAAHRELQRVDPVAAARIEPGNARRIARALEVITVTGRPFSSFGPGMTHYGPPAIRVRMAGVWLPRPVVASRIEHRFHAMCEAGLVDEVTRLGRSEAGLSRTARQAIGYKELLAEVTPGGVLPADAVRRAIDAAVIRTRSFARRQRMWFRRDPRIVWFGGTGNPREVLPALLAPWRR